MQGAMHVNNLPNECLLNIFQYLSLQDIVLGVRLTCSHWYNLSFNGCLWRQLKLDVGGLASRMSDDSFLCLLRSISESVEDIVFGYSCTISEASILHHGIFCPQLKSIDLRGLNIKAHYIDILLIKYPKIERLFLELNYSENCIHFFRCLHQYKLMFLKCLHVVLELGIDYESPFSLLEDEETCNRNSVLTYLNAILVESITNCSLLEHLSITFSDMTDITLSHIITKNKNLTNLSIAYCSKITGSAFDVLSVDNKLVSLNMDNTRLTNETIKIIASKCPKLKSVSLRNCNQVTDEGVLYLAKNCPMINKFILNHARFNQHEVTDLIAESNQQYPFRRIQQKSINLSTRVTDIGIMSLAHNCYRLCELGLAGCTTLTDNAIKQIAVCCPNLTLLNLSGCMYVSDSSVNLIILKCRNLEMLFLQTCYNVANIWFLNFSFRPDSSIPRLKPPTSEEVDFITSKCELKCSCSPCGSGDVDDDAEYKTLQDGSKKCAFCDVKNYLYSTYKVKQDFALTTFNLDFCNQISDDSLCRIAQNCPLLCEIWLQGCFRITDYGVGQLAEKCPLLTILDVSGGSVCEDMTLTDETLYKLAVYSQKLAYLNLVRNWKFTINGISEVLYKCKKLHKVSISRNLKYGVSELSVQNALDKIWACTAIKKLTDTNSENYMILTLYPHSRRVI